MKRKRKKQLRFSFWQVSGIVGFFVLVCLIYVTQSDTFTQQCANSLSRSESLTLKIENNKEGIFQNQKVSVPPIDLSQENQRAVLGVEEQIAKADPTKEKHIYVNLKTQLLSAYEGDELFMETPISTGLGGKTPTGEFTIWVKLRSTTMSGGSGADYYNLPNVPHVMFFSNSEVAASRGFSLHGTYWHNNFGHP